MFRSAAITLFLIPLTLSAQSPSPLQEEIVVTASALPESTRSTPASVTVIDREEIDASKARDVADLLREVPGVIVSRSGSGGKAASLFTRGGNSTHTLVLWNGIEINNPYFAGYDWGRFSTAGVQKIEIVRGPFSALYGSDAVSGVVNILTSRARSGFDVDVQLGERGLANAFLDGAFVDGPLNISATIEHREDDGWDANDDFEQDALNGGVYYSFGQSGSIGISARTTSYDLGIPFNVSADGSSLVPSLGRRQEGRELQIAVPFRHSIGTLGYEITFSQSSRDDDFADPDDPFGYTSASTESMTRRAHAQVEQQTRIGTLVAGGEYERAAVDDVSSFGVNLDDDQRTNHAFFIEDRASISIGRSRLEVAAGVRYDDFDTFGSETSPRVAAAWLAGTHKIHASYGEAFRAPSIGELYFPFSGNRDLAPEKSCSGELGYEWKGDQQRASIVLFHNDFDDLIVFDNVTYVFGNIEAASAWGAEISGQTAFLSRFQATASYTYLDTEDESDGRPLLRRPRHSGSIRLTYDGPRMRAGVAAIHNGDRDDLIAVFPYSRIAAEAFTTLDANVDFALGDLRPYIKVENLTGEEYEEVTGYRAPGRRLLVGLRYSK